MFVQKNSRIAGSSLRLVTGCVLALGIATQALGQDGSPDPGAMVVEGKKTVELLKQLIRIDTSSAPGDTTALATFLKAQFAPLGAGISIVIAPNGKASHFIARIRGDGSKKPILLAAQVEVQWTSKAGWR